MTQKEQYRERTNHILPPQNSELVKQLKDLTLYASTNEMKILKPKSKVMLLGPQGPLETT